MTKYNVVFSVSYLVEAEDKTEAEEKAWDLMYDDMPSPKYFGCVVEEVTE